MKRRYVLAGNYQQYDDWRRQNGLSPQEAVYVNDRVCLMGLHGLNESQIVRIGTWLEHPRRAEIERELYFAIILKGEETTPDA